MNKDTTRLLLMLIFTLCLFMYTIVTYFTPEQPQTAVPQPAKVEIFEQGIWLDKAYFQGPWEPASLISLKPTSRFEFLSRTWGLPTPKEESPLFPRLHPLKSDRKLKHAPSASDEKANFNLPEASEVSNINDDFPRIIGWPNRPSKKPDAPIEYEGIMVGRPDFISSVPGLALVPVQVDGHPEIKAAFFDCSIADRVPGGTCVGIQNMMRKSQRKVRIRQVQVAFLANQPVSIWVIEF
jgi:hypothetical protein